MEKLNEMAEVRKVETQQVDQKCPVCGNGWMRPNGIVPSPGQYEHSCGACSYTQIYSMRYPYTV
jgi:ribosomal protein S27AE